MKLKILTPTSVVFDEEIDSLIVDTGQGKVGILPRHAPYLTLVSQSFAQIKKNNQSSKIPLEEGLLEVNKNVIVIFCLSEK